MPKRKQQLLTLIVKAPLSTESNLSLEVFVSAIDPSFEQEQRMSRTRFERFKVLADGHLVFACLGELLESNHGKEYHSRVNRFVLEWESQGQC